MDSNTLAADGVTDTPANETSQDTGATQRTYTQQEFDDAMAKMKAVVAKKAVKAYEDLGDIEELRRLKAERDEREQQEALKRGEFEKIMQELAARKDAEIARRDAKIQEYTVDVPLVTEAARLRSVNPDQVKSLLRNQVRLNAEGEVEVVDAHGQVRYNDQGRPLAVPELVSEFLTANPHFVQPTPATTNSRTSITAPSQGPLDVTKLDMKNPEHRKIYAEYRKTAGIAR